MEHRDRATGWQHAKLSGHKNEDLVKMRLDADEEFATSLLTLRTQPSADCTKPMYQASTGEKQNQKRI